MFKFFRRNKDNPNTEINQKNDSKPENSDQLIDTNFDNKNKTPSVITTTTKTSFFSKLYSGLSKTRKQLFGGNKITSLFTGKVKIDDELWEDLESHLLLSDVGVELTNEILDELSKEITHKDSKDIELLKSALRTKLINILEPCEQVLDIHNTDADKPFVLLMVGVNGAGKTTTIGKLANKYKKLNKTVLLAAGDTFRAAAIEQLVTWGERNSVPVVAQQQGSDSASVIFDGYQSAKAKNINIFIADTAGRLHTQSHLMQELAKIKRVLAKNDATSPHEVLLVLDAGMGQNALQQVKQFQEVVDISGVVFTKLDGTAKGGVIFAIARKFGIPIRYIGVGEGAEDLQEFNARDFVDALIGNNLEDK